MTTRHPPRPIALIADDDDVMRLMLTEAAEQAGLQVVAVADGIAALTAGLQTPFTLALLDVEMPGLDGYQVCRGLRQSAHGRSAPILMITGHDDSASVEHAFEAGATDYIPKPLHWPLMPYRLRYVLRNANILDELEFREAENRTLLQAIPDRIHLLTTDGQVVRVLSVAGPAGNDEVAEGAGSIEALVPVDILPAAREALQRATRSGEPQTHEYDEPGADGTTRYYQMRYFRARGSEVIAMRQDVTLQKQQERRIRELAYNDTLTGLPNRQWFIERLSELTAPTDSARDRTAVIYLDLDRFRQVNDTFGHEMGDDVLRAVAERLGRCMAEEAAAGPPPELARIGGDEFVVAVCSQDARERAIALATACCSALSLPLRVREHDFYTEPSVGIAVFPEDGQSAETLLKNADTAMYQAKRKRAGGIVIYSGSMSDRAREWLVLDASLRRAVRDEMFELYYQPKLRLADGELVGVEALLRWFHPDLGEVSPARFIPLAEESGLILELGAWLIQAISRQVRRWHELGLHTPVSFNLSGKELLHGNPVALLRDAAAAAGIAPSCLEAEITESVFIGDLARGRSVLGELRDLGCRIALDDFGTGYSSLAYLKRLPPETLKVDRVFVNNVHKDRGDAAILDAILALARSLDVAVVAEGVENQAQADWLRARGCPYGQGFLLGRPMPAHHLESRYLRTVEAPREQSSARAG